MLKKILMIVLFIMPSLSWAWCPGFYLGAGVGADMIDFDQTAYIRSLGNINVNRNFDVIDKSSHGAQGILGSIFGGYGIHYGIIYLAGELNGDLSSSRFNASNLELIHGAYSSTIFKINKFWGASLLPGILLPETLLLYARIGYVNGNFIVNTTDNSLANTNTWLDGIRFGVGLEKRIFHNFGIIFEYSHIAYGNHSLFRYDVVGNTAKNTIISPSANQFVVGVDYRFCA